MDPRMDVSHPVSSVPSAALLLQFQHGEIIESSYLLAEKGPKSIWTKVLEMVVLVATIGGCAYLVLFLFHHGNHHDSATAKDSASHPHPPVGASSSTSQDPASCNSNSKCAELGKRNDLLFSQHVATSLPSALELGKRGDSLFSQHVWSCCLSNCTCHMMRWGRSASKVACPRYVRRACVRSSPSEHRGASIFLSERLHLHKPEPFLTAKFLCLFVCLSHSWTFPRCFVGAFLRRKRAGWLLLPYYGGRLSGVLLRELVGGDLAGRPPRCSARARRNSARVQRVDPAGMEGDPQSASF